MSPQPSAEVRRRRALRRLLGSLFHLLALLTALLGVVALALLLWDVIHQAWGWLSWDFLRGTPSRFPRRAGIWPALVGTLWLMVLTAFFTFPVGVAAAVYLEEFAEDTPLTRFIELNIANLAGVPSIIYGLLGLGVFVRALALGRSVLAGALTMSLLILPIVIISAQEALRAVPPSVRQGALALGATRWQTVWHQVLPAAFPGILTGTILALSRAIGETAPLITIGALTFVAFAPRTPMDPFTVLPIQIYNWASRPQADFHHVAAAAIVVLLVLLLSMNALAVALRARARRRLRGR